MPPQHDPTVSSLHEPLLPKSVPRAAKGSAAATATAFICFVLVRSVHPVVIDISKTDGTLPYGKATPCVVNSAVDVVLGSTLAYAFGGFKGLRDCWDPAPLKVFSSVAVLYAVGDFLEMVSLNAMGGAIYQILLQSKLVITAMMIWVLRGQRQTALQWNVLLTIMLGMSAFVLSDSGAGGGAFKPIGFLFVLAKVFFSCLCAVLTEKYLKAFSYMPIYAQVAQLKLAWFWVSLLLSYSWDTDLATFGFWHGWDGRTVVVATSWVCKGWTTFLVLKNLNSVLKNIGEAVAILMIYFFDVMLAEALSEHLPVQGKSFQVVSFLMVMVVVLTVLTYTMAAAPPPPAASRASAAKLP